MHWQENLVSGPASEPVILADAKAWSKVTIPDEDAIFTSLITAARRALETSIKAIFINQTWQWVGDAPPIGGGYYNRTVRQAGPFGGMGWLPTNNMPLKLPKTPLVAVNSINYLNSSGAPTLLDPSQYVVETGTPGRIAPAYGKIWPTVQNMIGAIKIEYVAGMGADATFVPESVKTAIKVLVEMYYRDRSLAGTVPDGVLAMLWADDPGFYG